MRKLVLVIVMMSGASRFALADNPEKDQKKALEQQAKTFIAEAKALEKAGNLLEARAHYANSQSFTETKRRSGGDQAHRRRNQEAR